MNYSFSSFKNEDFAEALHQHVSQLYIQSWISNYFDVTVGTENGVVSFNDKSGRVSVNSRRFKVVLNISEYTRQYFMNQTDWVRTFGNVTPMWIDASQLSTVFNGFPSKNAPGKVSTLYQSPFFVTYNNSRHSELNFLSFNNELKSNIEESILCMLIYNDEQNVFVPIYQPEINLFSNKCDMLNNMFEFSMYDSQKNLILTSNKSVLYIVLKFD